MNAIYQRNLSSNVYQKFGNQTVQYIPPPMISSPRKTLNTNYILDYGMKHYYSAEIKSDKKMNNDNKPIYISNPQFLQNQPLYQSSVYQIPLVSQVQITPVVTVNNMTNSNLNNVSQTNMNAISPQINLSQNIANTKIIIPNYYSSKTNKINNNFIIAQSKPTYNTNSLFINGQMIYNAYPQQNLYSKNTYQIKNYYNINAQRLTNEIGNNNGNNNTNIAIDNSNFNNTMPSLKKK